MTEIIVQSPGLLTMVQDLGRFGYQSMGVTPAGAMDKDALEAANLLVGNERGEACLECTLKGPELECSGPLVFAVCGAPMPIRINGIPVSGYETLSAKSGDVISLGTAETGLRSYIAFAGGFALEPVMESRSTYARASFGGWEGRSLRAGDSLTLRISGPEGGVKPLVERYIPVESRPGYPSEIRVRAVRSHESDRFAPESLVRFFSDSYTVSPKSDRMGCRLEGRPLTHSRGADIISSGVQTGTVQVPGDGLPIVLLADRQTTGGYTRIAHVIQADLPKLGQARPGDTIRFVETTVEAAQNAWKTRTADLLGKIKIREPQERDPFPGAAQISSGGSRRLFRVTVNNRAYDVELREI